MKLLVATTNPHKTAEFAEILHPLGIVVLPLDASDPRLPEPREDATTFEGNARIKATEYARAFGVPCLADDSGLEVDALHGAPGVRSARYAGLGSTRDERDQKNREKLIAELRKLGPVPRAARLVCALCFSDAAGTVLFEVRGTFEGEIIDEARGGNGFGYDAHLYLPDVDKTAAELAPAERNARSHRGQAALAFAAWLERAQGHVPGF
jgi:XTP/dITP diphosphohydrolase